jgi:hypothetical protein
MEASSRRDTALTARLLAPYTYNPKVTALVDESGFDAVDGSSTGV